MMSRKWLLEQTGHTVVLAMSTEIAVAGEEKQFEVAVIGQAFHPKRKRELFISVRNSCPSAKVLELYSANARPSLNLADDHLAIPADVPRELPNRVAAIVQQSSVAEASDSPVQSSYQRYCPRVTTNR
jgi:hypothetical protein